MRVHLVLSGLACAVAVAACSEKKPDPETPQRAPLDQPEAADLATGDMAITSKGGAFVMAVRNDSVLVAFSDSIRKSIRADITKNDKSNEPKDGLGGMIEGIVKKSVAAGLGEVFDKARGFRLPDAQH